MALSFFLNIYVFPLQHFCKCCMVKFLSFYAFCVTGQGLNLKSLASLWLIGSRYKNASIVP